MKIFTTSTDHVVARYILAAGVSLVAILALWVWHVMPIYPDEIGYQILTGRYIPDHGMAYGLFALCPSNFKQVTWFFLIPAWTLSFLDQHFSPAALRVFPFAAAAAAICLAAGYTVRRGTPFAAIIITSSLVGVAGSSMVLMRPEYVHILNLICCFAAYIFVNSSAQKPIARYLLIALLLISIDFSMYSHLQGMIFLPLTLYFVYCLICGTADRKLVAIAMLAIIGPAIYMATTANVYSVTCPEFPAIKNFLNGMTFHMAQVKDQGWSNWIGAKVRNTTVDFIYTKNYAINYLPSLPNPNWVWEIIFSFFNSLVSLSIKINLIFSIAITILMVLREFSRVKNIRYFWKKILSILENHRQYAPTILFAPPTLFLFFYDSTQNFYRSIFINFVLAIFLAICLSNASRRWRAPIFLYATFCAIIMIGSITANFVLFYPKLKNGYEGPSFSLNRDSSAINLDVIALAQQASMNLKDGGIIFDDLTYNSLKHYYKIYPVTYLMLSSSLAGIGFEKALILVKPNYAIVNCYSLPDIKNEVIYRKDNLCAINFNRPAAP